MLSYVRFNLNLPPVEDPDQVIYKSEKCPSRSRYRNEFEELKKMSKMGHVYLVLNKTDRLYYAIKKVAFAFRTGGR